MSKVNENDAKREAALEIIEKSEGTRAKNVLSDAFSADEDGNGAAFYVNLSVDTSGNDPVVTTDKTFAEMLAAYNAGQVVIGLCDYLNGVFDPCLAKYSPAGEDGGGTYPAYFGFHWGTITGGGDSHVDYTDFWCMVTSEEIQAGLEEYPLQMLIPG